MRFRVCLQFSLGILQVELGVVADWNSLRSKKPNNGICSAFDLLSLSRCTSCSSRSCLANPTYEQNHRVMINCKRLPTACGVNVFYSPNLGAYIEKVVRAFQLAAQHGCSCKTIYRHLRRARIRETFPQPAKANIIMDTTCFGHSFGVMVLMDSISGQALSVREVKHETNALYTEALNALREKGVVIQSIVCDGRKGLLQLFPEIPAQLCQFHQIKTVSRT